MYRSTAMEEGKGPEDVFVLIIIYGIVRKLSEDLFCWLSFYCKKRHKRSSFGARNF